MTTYNTNDKVEVLTGDAIGRGRIVCADATVVTEDGNNHAVGKPGWVIVQIDGDDAQVVGVEVNDVNIQKLGNA